ncbi:uncharacterized protein LOC124145565 isoform X2 [Haliotis rufescens]|uniref:uncharacterized protein LOC124145565 isoform X2 n=1 Tax=Haliotis rufescens TaxID=6454 RepID=UPI00201ED29B|nr:uncharacterized protein LOC124145565 isoform X2 [Haliotis rufescens]
MGFHASSTAVTNSHIGDLLKSAARVPDNKFDTISVDVNGIKKSVDILKKDTNNNKNAMGDVRKMMSKDLSAVVDGVMKTKTGMRDVKEDVSKIQKEMHLGMKNMAVLENEVMDIKKEFTTVNEDIAEIKKVLTSMLSDVTQMQTGMNDVMILKPKMTTITADVAALTEDITAVLRDVHVLKAQDESQDARDANLTSEISDLKSKMERDMSTLHHLFSSSNQSAVCPKPPQVDNADVAVSEVGSSVEYTCKSSFTLCGTAKVGCFTSGRWEDTRFTCEQSQWNKLGGPKNVPVPSCFKTGKINIAGTPTENTGMEVALSRANGDLIFYHHIRINTVFGIRMNCFNTFTSGVWEGQMTNNYFPWVKDVPFQYLLEVTPSSFEVSVDGKHMLSFPPCILVPGVIRWPAHAIYSSMYSCSKCQ